MLVTVRGNHIESGKCKVPERCMIAVAIKEAEPDSTYIRVRTNGITVTRRPEGAPATVTRYLVPLKAAKAIIAFDSGEKVLPFSFTAKEVDSRPARTCSEEHKQKQRESAVKHYKLVKAGVKKKKPPGINYASRIAGV